MSVAVNKCAHTLVKPEMCHGGEEMGEAGGSCLRLVVRKGLPRAGVGAEKGTVRRSQPVGTSEKGRPGWGPARGNPGEGRAEQKGASVAGVHGPE